MLRLSFARGAFVAAALAGVALAVACTDDNGTTIQPPYDAGPAPVVDAAPVCAVNGGAVTGAANARCTAADGGKVTQPVSSAACHAAPVPDAGQETDAAHDADAADGHSHGDDAGADDAGETTTSDYGDTLFGTEGDDDDCKYHVKWSAADVCSGADATFTVTISATETGAVAKGVPIRVEAFLDETHPAPNTKITATEGPDGTYKVGPVRFDKSGQWTVRFHFHEECDDTLEESPHGHAAFFVNVP